MTNRGTSNLAAPRSGGNGGSALKPPGRSGSQSPRTRITKSLNRVGTPTNVAAAAILVAAALWAAGAGPFINLVGQSCAIFAIAAVGQSILVGGAGQVAFSGGAFMAIGAFTAGILVQRGVENFLIILAASALAGWLVGLISGLPGLRFKGLYLLLSSVALQFIVTSLTRQYQHDQAPAGLVVPPLTIGSLDLSSGTSLYVFLIIVLLVIYGAIAAVERTGVGLAWSALRESEVAAAMSGVDVVRWKLYAFAASGAVTAVAGCLFTYWVGRADYETFNLTLTITLVTMIFIGGVHSRLGAILGAVIITALPYFLQNNVSVWLLDAGISFGWYLDNMSVVNAGLFSLMFLIVVLYEPEGIMGILKKIEMWLRSMFNRLSKKESQS